MEATNNQARRATMDARGFISARRGSTLFRQDKKTKMDEENIDLDDSPLIKSLQLQRPGLLSPTSPSAFDLMSTVTESPPLTTTTTTSLGNPALSLSEDKKRKIASTIFGSPREAASDTSHSSSSTLGEGKGMSMFQDDKEDSPFEGFSIIKNRMSSGPYASGPSGPSASGPSGPSSGAIHTSSTSSTSSTKMSISPTNLLSYNRTSLPRRNDSLGASNSNLGTPHSPQKYHTPMSNPVNAEKVRLQMSLLKEQVSSLREQLAVKDKELGVSKSESEALRARVSESDARCVAATEEVNAASFVSSLTEQKIEELETNMSRDRMEFNEALSQKSRRHKSMVKKLNHERAEYETRADQMIQQMQEQMGQLQVMAMGRIETLERDLMAQRHTNDKLSSEVTRLRAAVTTAQASAAKQRQLTAGLSMSSPPSGKFYRSNTSTSNANANSNSKNNTPRTGSNSNTPSKDTRKGRSSSTGSSNMSTATLVHEKEGAEGGENEENEENQENDENQENEENDVDNDENDENDQNDNDNSDIAEDNTDMWQACM
jgi:hypothetical protein